MGSALLPRKIALVLYRKPERTLGDEIIDY